jgi:hypothetical protein
MRVIFVAIFMISFMIYGCGTDGLSSECQAMKDKFEECQPGNDIDIQAFCDNSQDMLPLLSDMSCQQLGNEDELGKMDGIFATLEPGDRCGMNWQCMDVEEKDMVCRLNPEKALEGLSLTEDICIEKGTHKEHYAYARGCETDSDCIGNDICRGSAFWGFVSSALGTCEAKNYHDSCSCGEEGDLICENEEECGIDLMCVFEKCRRDCSDKTSEKYGYLYGFDQCYGYGNGGGDAAIDQCIEYTANDVVLGSYCE